MPKQSIVDYMGEQRGHNCGYCSGSQCSISHGMWAYSLTAQDYQDLIDRGWRRSGQYCYKPKMQVTCCPSYAIRCDALNFKMSKSQKKVVKTMNNFLELDKRRGNTSKSCEDLVGQVSDAHQIPEKEFSAVMDIDCEPTLQSSGVDIAAGSAVETSQSKSTVSNLEEGTLKHDTETTSDARGTDIATVSRAKAQCSGYDPSRGPCKKAKDIRRERRIKKMLAAGMSLEDIEAQSSRKCVEKSLEEHLTTLCPEQASHKIEFRLVPCVRGNSLFDATFDESYNIYKKYQIAVHHDEPHECTPEQFKRFLVKTPYVNRDPTAPLTWAPFHHQYVLDGKIIAVGVMDILPHCISSVYFYYDPDYSFLSLGRYSALTEIALVRKFNKKFPALKFYYMGFYIHSCPKMTYKGSYFPSYLLCPETYIFQPIERCKPKLDVEKYQRLEEDLEKNDVDGVVRLEDLKILYKSQFMNYVTYKLYEDDSESDIILREYAAFVGEKCYRRMYVCRC